MNNRRTQIIQELDEEIQLVKRLFEYTLTILLKAREKVQAVENKRLASSKLKKPKQSKVDSTKFNKSERIIKYNDNEAPLVVEF